MNLPPTSPAPVHRWRFTDFVLVWVAGFVASLAGLIVGLALGIGSLDDLTQGAAADLLFWVAAPAQFFGMLLALAWVSQRRGSGRLSGDFGFSVSGADLPYLFFGMLVFLVLGLAIAPIAAFLGSDETPQVTVEVISTVTDWPTRIVIAVIVAVVTPIVEEMTFRGLLLRYLLERTTSRAALVVSALLFAAFHAFGTNSPAAATVAVLQTFLAGLVLGHLAIRSGRLSRSIFTHAGFNLFTILVLFFVPDLPV